MMMDIKDTKINKNDNTNVNLKTRPSIPLLEEDEDSPPHTLPNPVPLTCIKIAIVKTTAKII